MSAQRPRPRRRNALLPGQDYATAPRESPPLSRISGVVGTAAAGRPPPSPPVGRFHPADPNEKNLYPFPPNQRPVFELFGPDELLVMASCQRDVYGEKHALMEQRRFALREFNRGRDWSYPHLVEYAHVKAYRDLLIRKKTFWEKLFDEATQYKADLES